jgi:hypothetical protein
MNESAVTPIATIALSDTSKGQGEANPLTKDARTVGRAVPPAIAN